ncbi:hypothetical protein H8356DRAFT_1348396 [Neocallimastix lanati (nom. inval.)]|nr:hypothetical protein H8356DRAFT_1348396 [Neocallimastix sp. JGI-2020a]
MPFLVRSADLFTEIMNRAITRNINVENAVKQASRTNASEREDDNFFQIVSSNSNPKKEFLLKHKFYNLEVSISMNKTRSIICNKRKKFLLEIKLPQSMNMELPHHIFLKFSNIKGNIKSVVVALNRLDSLLFLRLKKVNMKRTSPQDCIGLAIPSYCIFNVDVPELQEEESKYCIDYERRTA